MAILSILTVLTELSSAAPPHTTGFDGFKNPVDKLSWLVPSMMFGVLCGLSIDYDVFLLSRCAELRYAGLNDRDAIMCGVATTGGIISAAAGVMSIAFAGLYLSGSSSMNQMACFLVTSVLVDSLVIRTILVPSIMIVAAAAGRQVNWYPGKVPFVEY